MTIHKTFRLKHDLYYIGGFSLLLAGVIALGDSGWTQYLRVILGLPLILFFPGYALLAAIFPRKGELKGIERMALSFGLSIVVVPLIGLGLNFTPWGIRLAPILISLVAFIILFSALALYRRRKLLVEDVYIPGFNYELPAFNEMSRLDRALSVLLVLFILSTVGSVAYVRAFPKVEKFTEFYILGPDGKAGGYPTDLTVGKQAQVTVAVINHEYATVNYTVQVKMGDYVNSTTGPIALSNGQKWEGPIEFSANMPNQNIEVQFLLFRQGDTSPYRSLHIRVNVKAPPAPS
jgi:uncharacterized membrane protein